MAGVLRLKRLKLKAGSSPASGPLEIECPNVTIVVGPNNSGKSLLLREIETWCVGNEMHIEVDYKSVSSIELTLPENGATAMEMLTPFRGAPRNSETTLAGHYWLSKPNASGEHRMQMPGNLIQTAFDDMQLMQIRFYFVRFFTMRLDGRTRFALVQSQPTGPLEQQPANLLWALFKDSTARETIREFTRDAFGSYFVVDPTGMSAFRARLSPTPPADENQEQGLNSGAQAFHSVAPLVESMGDGVQTSVGLVAAVLGLADRILLIDEPEAFLHPTLARRVGAIVSRTARQRDASLVVATHSPEFLMGCVQAAPETRIIRVGFERGTPSARSLDPSELQQLMRDPLLRSANAMRAIFHRGVIVTEADADRALYDEINTRMTAMGRGVEDCLFMNAQNWQTIPRILAPLRKLGVPAAAIFDFDVLGSRDFGHVWPILNVSCDELNQLQPERSRLISILEKVEKKVRKSKGISSLGEAERPAVQAFVDKLSTLGVFFVPVGELEGWLSSLNHTANRTDKAGWLTETFTLMGSDPSSSDYVAPTDGDVWSFIASIKTWIDNPTRAGMSP